MFLWIVFVATLGAIAFSSRRALAAALAGLAVAAAYKATGPGFSEGPGFGGLIAHIGAESGLLANLFGLLTGFAVLARHFEASHAPSAMLRRLPGGWPGAFALLAIVFCLSTFLDNIAAAAIGAALAHAAFRGKVHVGYLAAIVAAANAGGSGSVLGDTTTTMIWVAGYAPHIVLDAFIAGAVALLVTAAFAAGQQQRHARFDPAHLSAVDVDWVRLAGVAAAIGAAVAANVAVSRIGGALGHWPVLAAALWAVLLLMSPLRKPDVPALKRAAYGSLFLLALVLLASMMPVAGLPRPTWQSTFGLGFASAVFDNIPLMALALKQGGYDWGGLAFAVGFGGSMIWFGSSAGVAVSNAYPEARSAARWIKAGWHVPLAYAAGYFAWLGLSGWRP